MADLIRGESRGGTLVVHAGLLSLDPDHDHELTLSDGVLHRGRTAG
jgi:hypothetical protein